MPFLIQYWNNIGMIIEFRGQKLSSAAQQVEQVHERRINKELGIIKRQETVRKNCLSIY